MIVRFFSPFCHAVFCVPLLLLLGACSMPKMPKLPDINVPFVGDDGTAPKNDPLIPYNLRQPLAPGHTLDIAAYAGQRSPAKIFSGAIMVDEDGKVDLGHFGKVKLGGMGASEAVVALEGAFRKKRNESLISVHLKSIEKTPLLQVSGAVAHPGVIQFFDGANALNILPYAGGRTSGAEGRAVYVTHEGVRKFHRDFAYLGDDLERGDIVTYSEEL